ncbi:transcription antitermination factor NusB [uncultured Propionibacterium sp.]|uniref:transcription antitermination factor NusB n=1 Tax=uncultured Propionibacterium sp. TaxID=218066 RepID=UPI00292D8E76|nr:transcription antitermination factor NusB [uncultured Propionibacterium sp.]
MSGNDEPIIELAPGEHPPVPGAVKVASTDFAGARHSTRTKARKQALDILFQAELRDESVDAVLERRAGQGEPDMREFAATILHGYWEHAGEVDQRVAECISGDWALERMPRVDRNLARIAMWELDFTGIAPKIAISEALELANELSSDESVAFLNGLLNKALTTRSG